MHVLCAKQLIFVLRNSIFFIRFICIVNMRRKVYLVFFELFFIEQTSTCQRQSFAVTNQESMDVCESHAIVCSFGLVIVAFQPIQICFSILHSENALNSECTEFHIPQTESMCEIRDDFRYFFGVLQTNFWRIFVRLKLLF